MAAVNLKGNNMTMKLSYDIEPDENGVFDGRTIARELIRDAYMMLIPYVGGCPDCTDELFSIIANEEINTVQQFGMMGVVMSAGEENAEGVQKHLRAAQEETEALLGEFAHGSDPRPMTTIH
jgi:hypothetical protein